ncbi:hypothetical protein BD311DRAFT_752705 [Dichomitus squalens]|uniref:Uncharacterized protein n=1 Tax=Dichomitus squalens TaxID=114155 RepID=A0A4Q9MXL7_9APHY|nr:hypothetical protein BD311DRAFT_752705 [Dichomitus squalens]
MWTRPTRSGCSRARRRVQPQPQPQPQPQAVTSSSPVGTTARHPISLLSLCAHHHRPSRRGPPRHFARRTGCLTGILRVSVAFVLITSDCGSLTGRCCTSGDGTPNAVSPWPARSSYRELCLRVLYLAPQRLFCKPAMLSLFAVGDTVCDARCLPGPRAPIAEALLENA